MVSVLASSVTGAILTDTGVTQLGFVVILVTVLILYLVRRRWVLREGHITVAVGPETAFLDA